MNNLLWNFRRSARKALTAGAAENAEEIPDNATELARTYETLMNIESTVSGTVLKVLVAPGDRIGIDQEVVIIESMKMEIPVLAEITGTVDEVLVLEGDTIEEGEVLVSLKLA